jgi:hypothetical protein
VKTEGRFFSSTLEAGLGRNKRSQSNFADKITAFRIGLHIKEDADQDL